jgi:hypothetical protein
MTADLARPVPAAFAPAFCAKKTSSVGGYLEQISNSLRPILYGLYQTTASWNKGSESVAAISVNDGSSPIMLRKSRLITWKGCAERLSSDGPGGTNIVDTLD